MAKTGIFTERMNRHEEMYALSDCFTNHDKNHD